MSISGEYGAFNIEFVIKFQTLYSILFGQTFAFMQLLIKILSEMVNSVDPDQTRPEEAVRPGSTLFAYVILSETFVSEILGHLL